MTHDPAEIPPGAAAAAPDHEDFAEHAEDVLKAWLGFDRRGDRAALAVLTRTEGGGVREPGALMAISSSGRHAGYLSGGCVDADIVTQAMGALEDGAARTLRYGAGSPYLDLPLPCGGAAEVCIVPRPDADVIAYAYEGLQARRPVSVTLDAEGAFGADHGAAAAAKAGLKRFRHGPKMRVRIAGGGADGLALARLARASGFSVDLRCRSAEDADRARREGVQALHVVSVEEDGADTDDPWTAFVMTAHDPDWETPILHRALEGRAFYVGAVGGVRAQAARRDALARRGAPPRQLRLLRGPVGLIPRMRGASGLAVSALGEMVECYERQRFASFRDCGIILLAAGAGRRFATGDKLLADLDGRSVLDHTGAHLHRDRAAGRIAIVGPDHRARAAELSHWGWDTVVNKDPSRGQSSSVKLGLEAAAERSDVSSALLLLADMPNVPDAHLRLLKRAIDEGASAAISDVDGVLQPPVMFRRDRFDELMGLQGDRGARGIVDRMPGLATVELAPEHAVDIDHTADLAKLHDRVGPLRRPVRP